MKTVDDIARAPYIEIDEAIKNFNRAITYAKPLDVGSLVDARRAAMEVAYALTGAIVTVRLMRDASQVPLADLERTPEEEAATRAEAAAVASRIVDKVEPLDDEPNAGDVIVHSTQPVAK